MILLSCVSFGLQKNSLRRIRTKPGFSSYAAQATEKPLRMSANTARPNMDRESGDVTLRSIFV